MAKVKRFGQGGSSSDPKRYIKRGPNGAQPASKPPVYQKEVAVRKPSDASSTNSKDVASKAKSTSIRPKVYEGEVSGSTPKNASGKASGNVYEGERVSKPVSKTSTISEGSYRELPKSTSSVASAKDKIVSGLEKSAKKVPAYEAIKGAAASKVDSSLGGMAARGLGRVAGPAAMAMGAKELYDSYEKYDELMPGTKPNMSKKSDSIVDAINAEPKAKASTPDVEIKKTEIVKSAPAASKPALKSGTSKPKGPTEGDRARNSMADEWAAFSKGREADTAALKDITDRYKQTGTLVKKPTSSEQDETSAEDMNTQGKLPEAMKKGGMTKRPPKPAKKVPPRKFASGGSTSRSSASSRGDGCATKGHTKGKYL